jgi:4'-phosphopantetheinyl transferase EntD
MISRVPSDFRTKHGRSNQLANRLFSAALSTLAWTRQRDDAHGLEEKAGLKTSEVMAPELFPPYVAHTAMRLLEEGELPTQIELPLRLSGAAPRRQLEYLSGRLCAQRALQILGAPVTEIPGARDGRPIWPAGFTGSITHTARNSYSAVASLGKVVSLGIDAEELISAEVATQIIPLITDRQEYRRLERTSASPELVATIVFSAKEAIYKCLYPFVGFRFDFTDVEMTSLDIGMGAYSFTVGQKISRFLRRPIPSAGKLAIIGNCVHTGVVLPLK